MLRRLYTMVLRCSRLMASCKPSFDAVAIESERRPADAALNLRRRA